MGRRVLITGLGTFWGGRVAQAMEADPDVDVIIGVDTKEPRVRLERTEYVRTDENYSILSRIVRATGVDTIAHTFLVVDSTLMASRRMHEINVIGTMNLLAAASAPGSTVKTISVKSTALVYGSSPGDPYLFRESDQRVAPAKTRVERNLLEVESYVRDFSRDNPDIAMSVLRFSNVLGPDLETSLSRALRLPLVPKVAGYDPRFQLVHERDVIRAITFALTQDLRGTYNVAADGQLPWSEIVALAGRRSIPMPPVGVISATWPLRRLGLVDLPPEIVRLLTYGRGVDNQAFKDARFDYSYTTAGAVEAFVESLRLRRTVRREPGYHYEEDVESFFRHSPAVIRNRSEPDH